MREWGFWYRPFWGQLDKLFVVVKANSYQAALMKFYAQYDDNCQEILIVEKLY